MLRERRTSVGGNKKQLKERENPHHHHSPSITAAAPASAKMATKIWAASPAARVLCGRLRLISAVWLDVAERPLLPVWMITMMKMMMIKPVNADGCTEPGPPSLHSTSQITLHASPRGYLQVHLEPAWKATASCSCLFLSPNQSSQGLFPAASLTSEVKNQHGKTLAWGPYAAFKAFHSGLLSLKNSISNN